MFTFIRPNRIAMGATITIAVAISCLGIARVQRFVVPAGGVSYTCSSGKACVEGNSTGKPYGTYGTSTGGNGVEGSSSAAKFAGVSGVQTGNDGIGVYAESHDTSKSYAALFARGDESTTDIFYGYNSSTHASCLINFNSDLSCKGTIAASPLTDGIAVMGDAKSDYGVEGISKTADGVHGVTSSTTGNSAVAGIATGTSGESNGVYGSSSNGPGIYGVSNNAPGVQGVSTSADGIYGATSSATGSAGVAGVATGGTGTSSSANGVYGSSANGYGVYGTTEAPESAAVYGYTTSPHSVGVEGTDGPGTSENPTVGVLGADTVGEFGVAGSTDNGGYAVWATVSSSSCYIFYGLGPNGGHCQIDESANLYCSGQITSGQMLKDRHRASGGRHVLAYSSESTSATIEDFGTARIVRGVANVQIEPTFASTIDRNNAYYVFLTPLGDTRGLYVSSKTPSGFQVRETEGGHSNLDFDYRVVAHPADAANGRLPDAPVLKRPPTLRIPRTRVPRGNLPPLPAAR